MVTAPIVKCSCTTLWKTCGQQQWWLSRLVSGRTAVSGLEHNVIMCNVIMRPQSHWSTGARSDAHTAARVSVSWLNVPHQGARWGEALTSPRNVVITVQGDIQPQNVQCCEEELKVISFVYTASDWGWCDERQEAGTNCLQELELDRGSSGSTEHGAAAR